MLPLLFARLRHVNAGTTVARVGALLVVLLQAGGRVGAVGTPSDAVAVRHGSPATLRAETARVWDADRPSAPRPEAVRPDIAPGTLAPSAGRAAAVGAPRPEVRLASATPAAGSTDDGRVLPMRPAAPAPAASPLTEGPSWRGDSDPEGPALDEGLFELVVDHVATRPTLAVLVDPTGRVLLPVREVLEHVEIPVAREDGRLRIEWPTGVWSTLVDPAAGSIRVGANDPVPLEPGSWAEEQGRLHLSADALATLLGVPVQVVWSDLVVRIEGARLPVGIRALRELRRRIGTGGAEVPFGPDPYATLPFRARTGGLAASWGVSAHAGSLPAGGSARLALGGSLWGGATEISGGASFGRAGAPGLEDLSADYARPVFGTSWLRAVELGSVTSRGVFAHRLVGAVLTNEPYTATRYFDRTAITPAIPSGWEAEVYQSGHLVGVSDGSSEEPIEAHLGYGSTPVRIRLLGPAGQERTQELLFVVNPRQVPEGDLRYDLGAGLCRDGVCERRAFGGLRYGLRSWLTVGGGIDHELRDEGAGDARLHGSLVVRPRRDLSADVTVEPGSFLQASADFRPSLRNNVSASYTWSDPEQAARGFAGWQGRMQASSVLPLPGGARSVGAHLLLQGAERGRVDGWRAGLSVPAGRTLVATDVESGLQRRDLLSVRTYTTVGTLGPRVRDLALDAALRASTRGVEVLSAGIAFRPVAGSTLQAGVELPRGTTPRLTLALSSRTPFAFARTRAVAGGRGGITTSFDGGVAFDGGLHAPTFHAIPAAGHAGISGRIFHDLDGDGVRGPGDLPAAGVEVSVAGQRVVTDEDGIYRVWGLRPYEPVPVAVDSSSLAFDLTPALRGTVVRPSPNVFNEVDLPLLRTRELVGRVEVARGPALGGVAVEVVDDDGQVVAAGRTFSDGAIYIQRVPVGAYTVRVAAPSLQALGASCASVSVHVPLDGNESVEVPTLQLEMER